MNKRLNDKIKGALYGCAYGDTLGIGTEFMSKREARRHYPDGLRSFDKIIKDAHRVFWAKGHWSHGTEKMVHISESVLRSGRVELPRVTRALRSVLQDNPVDIAPYFQHLVTNDEWLDNPLEVSRRYWETGDRTASNESLQHSIVAAFVSDDEHFEEDALNLSGITHYDIRCQVCGLLSATMARSILFTGEPADYETLAEVARSKDTRILPYLEIASDGHLDDLDLDDGETWTFTRKTLAAALWAIWHCDNAADMIHFIVDEGGDAATNAALAGTFAGLLYGYDAIPVEKEKISGRERLDLLADRLTEHIERTLL